MKCSAAETDIIHLFGIMLGRKPSPDSYLERNKGRSLRELTARMAASPEFKSKVISPILLGQADDDRELSPDERDWLVSGAQLPCDYRKLLTRRPTRHRAALALTARAFEAAPNKDRMVIEGVSKAFDALGLDSVPQPFPAAHNNQSCRPAKDQLTAEEANEVWSLIAPGRKDPGNAAYTNHITVDELATQITASKYLPDLVVPSLCSREDDAQSRSVRPLIEAMSKDDPGRSSPVGRVLHAAALRDPDTRDAVAVLVGLARSRATVRRFLDNDAVGAAVVALDQLAETNTLVLADLTEAAEAAVDVAGAEDARSILASVLAARAKGGQPLNQGDCRPVHLCHYDGAQTLLAGARDDVLYFVLENGVGIPDLVQSGFSTIASADTVIPVRCADSIDRRNSMHNTFEAEVSGLAAVGPSGLQAILEQWPARGSLDSATFVPGIRTASGGKPLTVSESEAPIILVIEGADFDAKGYQTLTVRPDQTFAEVLSSASVAETTPVIFLDAGLRYAKDYVDVAMGHFIRLNRPPILPMLTVRFATSCRKAHLSEDAALQGDFSPFVWLPMSVVTVEAARRLTRPVAEMSEHLFGTGQILAGRGCGSSDKVVFGCAADIETRRLNASKIESLIESWSAALDRESPPLAPNLISTCALKREAIAGHATRAAIAKRILSELDDVFAVMKRVALGQSEPRDLDQYATDGVLDRLLDFGTQDRLSAVLPDLWGNRGFCRRATPKTLVWLMHLSRLGGLQAQATDNLRFNVDDVLSNEQYLVRELSDFLAGALDPREVTGLLLAFLRKRSCKISPRNARRFAEALQLYGDWFSATEFLQLMQEQFAEDGLIPLPIANRVCGALMRGARPTQQAQSETMVARPEQHLNAAEQLKRAVLAGCRDEALQTLCMRLAETPDIRRVLDPLRALSLQASFLGLGSEDLPYHHCNDDTEKAIMAVIFSDLRSMQDLSANGLLPTRSELSILLEASLGNMTPLADRLTELGGDIGVSAPDFSDTSERRIFNSYRAEIGTTAVPASGRVSVVMSTLNTDRCFLMESVKSILGQTYEDLELLLIDDGGAPEAAVAVAEAAGLDARVRAFTMPKNLGPYMCRNFALSLATGDYIAIQDADDVCHPERLAVQVQQFCKDSQLDLVTSNHLRIDPRGWPQFEHGFRLFGDGTMTSMFRRSVFDRLGGFQPVRSRGDVEYRERIRRMCGSDAIRHLDYPLVACHAGIETLSQRTAHAKGPFLQLFRRAVDQIRMHPCLAREGGVPTIAIPAPLSV